MQRINAILMVIVVLAVIGVSVQVYVTQRYNTLALQEITMQLTNMRVDAAAEARQRGWTSSDEKQVQVVPMRNADAHGVRDALATLFDRRDATITVDPRTNSLIVSATPDMLREILEKLLDLDRPAGEQPSVRASLAPGDAVTMEVYGLMEADQWFRATRTIEADGIVRFPIIGDIDATGRTPREVEAAVLESASKIVLNPVVSVYTTGEKGSADMRSIASSRGSAASLGQFYVSGAVKRAGLYELPTVGRLTLRRAIAAAGALSTDEAEAAGARVVHMRQNGERVFEGSLQKLHEGDADPEIEPLDLIVVRKRH